jgi:hypothetical protein
MLFYLLTIHVFLVGAKIEYLFYLLQAKNKKITADYKSLTFEAIKDLFLSLHYQCGNLMLRSTCTARNIMCAVEKQPGPKGPDFHNRVDDPRISRRPCDAA